ncbi:Cof-type HAD-IIB family hydrolase [Nocardioides sp.]|uniref:Cof-type HAD-IIB family hydrolase n=1 Tax=Nocardioides sp. TaxID=35761 RepID=UPI00271E2552|nr:Cof-type HAD-IIB family hydrolase [Nocardioides sp.]MDO9456106.1 Cof-type HAD-IIB family hydrolase [Nocardioides sp.]
MSAPGLVASDLDGTLLRSDGTVSGATRRVLAAVEDAGVPVVFVSGRPLRWMTHLWEMVGAHGLAIAGNGAVVYDVAAGEVRRLHGIERAAGLAVVETIRTAVPGALFAFEDLGGIAIETAQFKEDLTDRVGPVAELWSDSVTKVLVRGPGLEPAELQERVAAAVGDAATVTWSMPGLVEISATGVTKAAALAEVCDGLGVPSADAVAFGDMPNDLAMLAWAGTSYAVANAHPTVLAGADHVAPGHDADGVAQTLARLVPITPDLL